MNIPDIRIDTKQGMRSESVTPAKAVARQPDQGETAKRTDAVNKQDASDTDAQSNHFSREELNTLVAEAEKQLENSNVQLKFNILEENDTVQVEIVDAEGKTIRKIPDDDFLKLTKSLKNLGQGFLNEVS
ncbi:flagellar protein FlaG [Pseudodesulfovibrio sediminis]|uniref:Flagellar protein FlaG n=1 Tax=Pseudodesulfovibrio sediminis TaxID=2810563 RepID=A0ABM7P2P8_9BACT|nr:flagellar protein FlaG [Pseudodesulfovibrio sediminis]BCS87112.1 hypothetical protein PSDVSF_03540 [Pseudodesulfovibrio sediminis]